MTRLSALAILSASLVTFVPCAGAAEPTVLRMASIAPEGSTWANLMKAYAREIEPITNGAVRVKWYFGGITGDELETFRAIQAGHLDGIASGGIICEQLSPSMRIQGLAGVFQSRDEAAYVMGAIHETIEAEAQRAGFAVLITTGLGPEVIFTRAPVRSLAELRKLKLWRWGADDIGIAVSKAMGMSSVATDVSEAGRAYDDGRTDGFVAIPTAALAFQWSAQARYITDLRVGYLTGCIAIANRALDKLPPQHQRSVRALMAKYSALFQSTGLRQDDALLGGLFEKQGLRPVPPSESFRSEFFDAARVAREQTAPRFLSRAFLDRVLKMLADYRAEHPPLSTR